jgi:trimeric autotransporter adhesin
MNTEHMRATRLRRVLSFAFLAAGCANLANAAAPDITITPTSLSFKYQIGAALPASQTLQLKSTGTALSYSLSITGPLPYSAQWLSLSANAGTTTGSPKVYVNPTGLPAGTYTGTIVVSAPAAVTTSQNINVTLDVGDPPPAMTASTGALTFTYTTGGTLPASQPVVLTTTGVALNATIAITGGTWLKASPSGTIALVGLPSSVTVTADPTGLSPGTFTGKITFTSTTAANKSVTVNVTLTVSAGVPAINAGGLWPPGVLVSSPATIVTINGTNFFSTSLAFAGTTQLATTVLSSTTLLATVPANLLTTAGNLAITVSTPSAATPSAPAAFAIYGPGPQVWAVANAASYAAGTISPGEIVTIYGIGLGPASLSVFPGTSPLPTSLPATGAATSVTVDGVSAPLIYTSATQVSCIVPYAAAAKSGSNVDIVVTYNAVDSTALQVAVVDAQPGVFTVDSSGIGQGAILNYNSTTGDYTVNGSANAAAKGSIIVIYMTGYGQTNPVGDETQLIAGTVVPVVVPTVTIGGQSAAVQAAQAPLNSVAGLLQINATVPATVTAGNTVPVIVSVGTTPSQTRVTMAVK